MTMMDASLSAIVLPVLAVAVVLAGFDRFRQRGATIAESAAYSLVASVMLQSWLGQVLVLSGWPEGHFILAAIISAALLLRVGMHRRQMVAHGRATYRFFVGHRLPVAGLTIAWLYLFISDFTDTAPIAPVLRVWWEATEIARQHSLSAPPNAIPVLNSLVLHGPWHGYLSIVMSQLAAYMTIGFGTYALARRYAWPPMAMTVVLLVSGMPRLIDLTRIGSGELLVAAAGLTAVVALYRLIEKPEPMDLVMFCCATAFTVEGGALCYLVALVLGALAAVLVIRRHGLSFWRPSGPIPALPVAVSILGVGVFSQVATIAVNLTHGVQWIGVPPDFSLTFNQDPLWGTARNLIQSLAFAIDIPGWLDTLWRSMGQASLTEAMGRALVSQTMVAPPAIPDDPSLGGEAALAVGFGPVGLLLVLPAILYALWRGPRRLKATALALVAYWLLVCLILTWQPQTARWLTPVFVCGGFFTAFFLPPWRIGHTGRTLLQMLALAQIAYSLA